MTQKKTTTPIQYSRKTSVNDNEYDNDDNCNNNTDNNDKQISNGWIRMTTMIQIKTITATTTTTSTTTIIINKKNNTIDSICLLQLIIHAMAL